MNVDIIASKNLSFSYLGAVSSHKYKCVNKQKLTLIEMTAFANAKFVFS